MLPDRDLDFRILVSCKCIIFNCQIYSWSATNKQTTTQNRDIGSQIYTNQYTHSPFTGNVYNFKTPTIRLLLFENFIDR